MVLRRFHRDYAPAVRLDQVHMLHVGGNEHPLAGAHRVAGEALGRRLHPPERKERQRPGAGHLDHIDRSLERTVLRTVRIANRQMVEVARAFTVVDTPLRLVILDEPTSSLDAVIAQQLLAHVRRFVGAGHRGGGAVAAPPRLDRHAQRGEALRIDGPEVQRAAGRQVERRRGARGRAVEYACDIGACFSVARVGCCGDLPWSYVMQCGSSDADDTSTIDAD